VLVYKGGRLTPPTAASAEVWMQCTASCCLAHCSRMPQYRGEGHPYTVGGLCARIQRGTAYPSYSCVCRSVDAVHSQLLLGALQQDAPHHVVRRQSHERSVRHGGVGDEEVCALRNGLGHDLLGAQRGGWAAGRAGSREGCTAGRLGGQRNGGSGTRAVPWRQRGHRLPRLACGRAERAPA
jgi:hypothetical protein